VGDTDMKPVLTRIATNAPEIIYYPIFEPEGDFIAAQRCEVAGLENTIMMAADGLYIETMPEASGDCATGMYLSGPFVSGDRYQEFRAAYEAKFGEGPISGFHAHGYDAANIIFAAIEKVAVQDADGTLHIPRQALRDAAYATENFDGLTGNLTCDENGDCATGEALAVFQVTADNISGATNLFDNPPFWQPGG
jgi:branched-chain amino acid transport system substrate-binding protein